MAQVSTILLDEGIYRCSQATMHRLLRQRGQSGERRAEATCPARKNPNWWSPRPNEVWSWDITKLKGPARGIWYLLYVILDIYSRKVIHWEIWPTETGRQRNSSSTPSPPTTAPPTTAPPAPCTATAAPR